jgi:flagellin
MYLNNTSTLNSGVLNQKDLQQSLNKLSSGLKINKASDDASGLAISDKLRTQATSIKQGVANANSAIAMMNIADKAMDELSKILDTIKSKAIQMNTDTTSEDGRKIIKTEILKLIDTYDEIVCSTNYNTVPLLKGCASPLDFQVGSDAKDLISVDIDSLESQNMGNDNPNRLKNFITGFNKVTLNDIISSDIPGFENFDWTNATRNADGYYVIEDFDPLLEGNQVMDLSNATKTLLNIDSSMVEDIEFTFNNFDFVTERFTIIDSKTDNIEGRIKLDTSISGYDISFTDNRTGYIIEEVALNNNFVEDWYYENNVDGKEFFLISDSLGSIKLENVKKDVRIDVTGAFLTLNRVVIKLRKDLPTDPSSLKNINSSTLSSCSCSELSFARNDTDPDLRTQAQILLDVVDTSLTQLNSIRSNIGAATNQLESSARNLMTNYTNTKAAESIIRDVDYSKESANFNKLNIINQAFSYTQVQANQNMARILDLLK